MVKSYVKVVEGERYATVKFHHPKSNALDSVMLSKLAAEISALGSRTDLNVIAIQSEGSAFCAGAFFDDLLAIRDLKEGESFFGGFAKIMLAIKSAKSLVVTKAQGKAVGGAVGILAASDYVIASNALEIRLSELTIGIGPFVISPLIKKKMSEASFMHLALNPKKWFSAKWCAAHSLVNQIEDEAALDLQFYLKVKELSSYNAEAIQALKAEEHIESLKLELKRLAGVSGGLVIGQETKRILKQISKQ